MDEAQELLFDSEKKSKKRKPAKSENSWVLYNLCKCLSAAGALKFEHEAG
jgi:hypothetical protein